MATAELDIDGMSDRMMAEINGDNYEPPQDADTSIADDPIDAEIDAAPDNSTAEDAPPAKTDDAALTIPEVSDEELPVPQSWKKEMHPIWNKLAKGEPMTKEEARTAAKYYNEREQQMLNGLTGYKTDAEYGRSLKQVISQYQDVLESQGIDAAKAVNYLFAAHKQLSSGTAEQRRAYFDHLARSYGIQLGPQPEVPQEQQILQQALTPLQQRLERFEQSMMQREQAEFEARKQQALNEVEKFASDPGHPYFDELQEEILPYIQQGLPLAQAYEKAVWSNPVTRQKEMGRIQKEQQEQARKKAQAAATAAKKATSANVKSRDTNRTQTGDAATLDNMDEVLRETLAEIRSRP